MKTKYLRKLKNMTRVDRTRSEDIYTYALDGNKKMENSYMHWKPLRKNTLYIAIYCINEMLSLLIKIHNS